MIHLNFAVRDLRQQTKRDGDMQQQQQAGRSDSPPGSHKPEQQMGEGSYEATRDYQKNIGEYLKKADVEADAEAAKPHSEEEAQEMKKAEEEGRSHSKGER